MHRHISSPGWRPDDLGGPGSDALRLIIEEVAGAEIPTAVQLLDSLAAALVRYDIVLYVTSEDVTRTGRLFASWAAAHGIPSLQVAHAIALADPASVHGHLDTDVLAVYGERGAEGYLDLGIAPERLIVTGNPGWDEYADLVGRRAELRSGLDDRYGLDPALPLVVFGTTWAGRMTALEPAGDPNQVSLRAFVIACEALLSEGFAVNAVIKDRPSNNLVGQSVLEQVLAATGSRGRYLRTSEDTRQFAAAADVMVAVDSNYLVEAMLAGTPVVNLVSDTLAVLGPTFEEETGVVEAEPDQLAGAIRRLVEDGGFRAARLAQAAERLGYYHHGGPDGQAGRRVGELMARLALPRPGPVVVLADRAVQAVKRVLGPMVRRVRRLATSR